MSSFLEYYRDREWQETARAKATTHVGARRHHLELAALFRERRTKIEAHLRSGNDAMAEIERIVAAIKEADNSPP